MSGISFSSEPQKRPELALNTTVLDHLPQMIWTSDAKGQWNYGNQVYLQYTGINSQEKFGLEWVQSLHREDRDRVMESWARSIRHEVPFNEEYRVQKLDGMTLWFLGRASAVKDSNNKILYWIGSATEIDAQKKAVETLESERTLREQFISTLTHDLRNPFSAAKITAQLLTRQVHSPEKIKNLTARIIASLNRANQMIENLLDANRIRAGLPLHLEMEKFSCLKLIRESVQELNHVHGERFRIDCNHPEVHCFGSPDAVKRIIENLCSNAAKYGDDKSPITLFLTESETTAIICVHNHGNPISVEDQAELFNLKPSLKASKAKSSKQKGWGLGLTLVRGLAQAHGGNVEVISEPEKGTFFTVTLKTGVPSFSEANH